MNPALLYTAKAAAQASSSNWLPSDVFPEWDEDGTNILVPISSFTGLTAAAADGVNGDVRQVALSLQFTLLEWYNSLASASRPDAMELKQIRRQLQTSGSFEGKEEILFQSRFYIDYIDQTIADEP